jgi:hypothetical protein
MIDLYLDTYWYRLGYICINLWIPVYLFRICLIIKIIKIEPGYLELSSARLFRITINNLEFRPAIVRTHTELLIEYSLILNYNPLALQ